MKTFSLIIPCYNESKNIPIIIKRYKQFSKSKYNELIIVDNGSTDNTYKTLINLKKKNNFRFVKIKKNIGYGYGLKKGIKYSGAKNIICAHGDEEINYKYIIKCYKYYKKNNKKFKNLFVKGNRIKKFENNWSFLDIFFSISLNIFSSILFLRKLDDIHGYPVIFPKKMVDKIKYEPNDFTIDLSHYLVALKKGYTIRRPEVIFKRNRKKYGGGSSDSLSKKIIASINQIIESFKMIIFN